MYLGAIVAVALLQVLDNKSTGVSERELRVDKATAASGSLRVASDSAGVGVK